MKPIIKKFRLQAKKVFLTYANCDKALISVLKDLRNKFKNHEILSYILYINKNQKEMTNNNDVCVYLYFDRKIDIENISFFDLEGCKIPGPSIKKSKNNSLRKIFVPKIEPVKDLIKTWQDIAMDAVEKTEYLVSKDVKKYLKYPSKVKGYKRFMFSCASLGFIKHAMIVLKHSNPRVYSKSSVRIENYLRSVYTGRPNLAIRSMSDFKLMDKN